MIIQHPQDIESRLERVFAEVLWGDPMPAREVTRINSSKWDSMAHMNLVVCIEEEFHIRLTDDDVLELTSFAAATEIVRERLLAENASS